MKPAATQKIQDGTDSVRRNTRLDAAGHSNATGRTVGAGLTVCKANADMLGGGLINFVPVTLWPQIGERAC
jgi:hypothetical protein